MGILDMHKSQLLIIPAKTLKIIDNKSKIQIQNNSLKGYAFKIRTTSPESYNVRPNIGSIKPLETVTIDVLYTKTNDSSHKFNIQVFEFDHKKSLDSFKKHIQLDKPKPFLSSVLIVETNTETEELQKQDSGSGNG